MVDCSQEHDIPEEFCFADLLVADERLVGCHPEFDGELNICFHSNAEFRMQEIQYVYVDSVVLYILPEQDSLALCELHLLFRADRSGVV